MSGIEFKPISDSNIHRSNFLLPLGKTVIGRGPVLGVSDKRVSRNHGVVEVEDGKVKIMSTHTNPTFYQPKGTSKLSPLPKDAWQALEHGDRISLTPDQHIYEVVIDERPVNKGSQSLGTSLIDSPIKELPKKQEKPSNEGDVDREPQENDRNEESSTGSDSKIESNNTHHKTKQNADKEEDKDKHKQTRIDTHEDAEDETDKAPSTNKNKPVTVKLPGQKEVALPLEKKRKLPAWMVGITAESSTAKTKDVPKTPSKGRGRPKATATKAKTATPKSAKKRISISDDEVSAEDMKPAVKKTPSRGRGRPKAQSTTKGRGKPKKHVSDDEEEFIADDNGNRDDVEEEEEEEEKEEAGPRKYGHGKTRDQASVKRKAKLALDYSEDFAASDVDVLDEDEEIHVPIREGDESSDWEPESHTPRLTRTPSKGKRTPGRPPGRTLGRKRSTTQRSSRQSSDEDSDWSEEEVYIPRPTKRSGRAASSSQESDSQGTQRKRAKKADNGKKTREPCQYGKKCYRKNPVHFEEFCHPGDSDFESPNDEEEKENEKEEEVEKEECPHGTDCYRRNKRHLEQYKHTKALGRPKRQAAKKATIVDGASDDDGEANTYDYNDSLIDDGTQGTGKDSGSEDWTPGVKDDDD